jgi:hypothetical protein
MVDLSEKKPEPKPQIELRISDAEQVKLYSVAEGNECLIDSIWVLVFDSSTGNLKAAEHIGGDKIVKNGQATQLMPQLTIDVETGDRVVCIANTDPNPDTATVKLNTINSCFALKKNTYYNGIECLPMYGAMEWTASTGYACEMIRAVAKIQVQMGAGVSDVTGHFTAENVYSRIYRCNFEGGFIQPIPGVVSGITDPRPNDYRRTRDFFLVQKDNEPKQNTHVYLYEFPSSNRTVLDITIPIDNKTFNANRQHIMLINKFAPTDSTFYRLDFYDAMDSVYLDTKRNHFYLFTINKVRSEGYKTIDEARVNPGSNIEYTVYINDGSSSVTSNGQYAIVTSVDTAYIASGATGVTIATARYQLPAKMPSLTATTNTIVATGALALAAGSITSLTNVNGNVIVNATGAGLTSGSIQGRVVFTLGNITHTLVVKVR